MTKPTLPQHHIQQEIFSRLVASPSLRYSELKPSDIEANSFMYHLKELRKARLVDQNEDKTYTLSAAGRDLSNSYSLVEKGDRRMPSVKSILLITNPLDDEILLYERLRHPGYGSIGLPSGNIHYGEDLSVAAQREALEKCDYPDLDLSLVGSINLVDSRLEEVSQIVGFISHAEASLKRDTQTKVGRAFWGRLKDQETSRLTAGIAEIIEAYEKETSKPFLLDMSA